MSNFRRRLMMNFEKKYTPVKYLESTGTQYINTGYVSNNGFIAELKINFENVMNNTNKTIIGLSTIYGRMFFDLGDNTRWRIAVGNDYADSNVMPTINTEYVVNVSTKKLNSYIIINNQTIQEKSIDYTSNPDKEIYVFARNNNGVAAVFSSLLKMYYCKIYDNDTLVRDLIPCLDENNTPCLYDKVEDKFYYNEGTGEFLYG